MLVASRPWAKGRLLNQHLPQKAWDSTCSQELFLFSCRAGLTLCGHVDRSLPGPRPPLPPGWLGVVSTELA